MSLNKNNNISVFCMFGHARNHGKMFLKYSQTSFSGIFNSPNSLMTPEYPECCMLFMEFG